jgi:hypothetical protein
MKYLLLCTTAYELENLKDCEEAKKLILKDDKDVYIKIIEVE